MNKTLSIILLLVTGLALLPKPVSAQFDDLPDINEVLKDTKVDFPMLGEFIPDDKEFDKNILDSVKVFQPLKEFTWGDPVRHSRIRRNKASNLFGLVRHNSDGSRRWHHGFDITAPIGTPILSVGPGTVVGVGNNGGYGLCILIEHKVKSKSYFSFYAHLSSAKVRAGQNVKKGSVIGKSGTSGNAAGMKGEDEHVHFEYRVSAHGGTKNSRNPNPILRTKFYSENPKKEYQNTVSVVTRQN